MKARAAVLWEQPGKWTIEDVELDGPRAGEVLVEMVATGLCHSDDHMAVGDVPCPTLPFCAGHEGAGIVREVGPGVRDLKVGDHIITSFVPSCGKCRWCASGMQHLCDYGALIMTGAQLDGTCRMHIGDADVPTAAMLGTFATHQVFNEESCIKIRQDVPLNVACIAACGVPTGWGSATNAADVRPGDVVVVMGTGGLGMSAVQGARFAGAAHVIAVEPVAFKREKALELGATEAYDDIDEATEFARSITNGQGADSAIITTSLITGEHVNNAFKAIRKAGTVAVTAQGSPFETGIPINLFELSMYQKRIQGVLFGMSSPREAVPMLLDLYAEGQLKLDEMITTRYTLDQINDGYADMHAGRNIRGVIDF
ncbi:MULTISPECIES: NDMA-dependent alcohol dehydrogenase [unclassified Rhodococcus (in: high G+C Gram-positive bacteria)]|uniref:NDMA-dependent alcohol dehydrogenase n=1 Tax=unclassified Rhodococcus (in: high G+C Gram-positive bacteria) TaxID=192944 RepID=UPI00092BFFD6|nr:NDMA-dependent alcohol dehydrogenase [Rhodococcus sp. M8]OLL19215.1 alcohol dehydrogenase [Rhodococcus sp. M8]QPG48184.1 NDMA-dependent alcohol dehydrogenase [Rhodococcus sp. M8]